MHFQWGIMFQRRFLNHNVYYDLDKFFYSFSHLSFSFPLFNWLRFATDKISPHRIATRRQVRVGRLKINLSAYQFPTSIVQWRSNSMLIYRCLLLFTWQPFFSTRGAFSSFNTPTSENPAHKLFSFSKRKITWYKRFTHEAQGRLNSDRLLKIIW